MRLTQHTDYALRTLMYLEVGTGRRHTIRDVAEAFAISRHHLTKVVQQLHHHDFVAATRGKGGGLTLARPAAEIVVGEVFRKMETSSALVECFEPDGECAIQGNCGLARALREALEAFAKTLDGYTLADIVGDRRHHLRKILRIPLVELDADLTATSPVRQINVSRPGNGLTLSKIAAGSTGEHR